MFIYFKHAEQKFIKFYLPHYEMPQLLLHKGSRSISRRKKIFLLKTISQRQGPIINVNPRMPLIKGVKTFRCRQLFFRNLVKTYGCHYIGGQDFMGASPILTRPLKQYMFKLEKSTVSNFWSLTHSFLKKSDLQISYSVQKQTFTLYVITFVEFHSVEGKI